MTSETERLDTDLKATFDRDGYLILPALLSAAEVQKFRCALAPFLAENVTGRNDFEGLKSNRVYAMLAKDPVFSELVTHPTIMSFANAELGDGFLLSACLAINLHPGESAQPWHTDDDHYQWPRPRPSLGVSAFWALDDLTETNGATEVIPGSHLWGEEAINGGLQEQSFDDVAIRDVDDDPGARDDAVKAVMPAGSLMLAKGTLFHRGGANKSDAPRLIVTPQYCPGWTRQLENMSLAVPPAAARKLPERARELLGYSIHAPFMGYVNGVHPKKSLLT